MNQLQRGQIIAFILAAFGFIAALNFERLAQWGMVWYWIGAGIAYLLSIVAGVVAWNAPAATESAIQQKVLRILIIVIAFLSILFTSFVIYIWYAKDFSI